MLRKEDTLFDLRDPEKVEIGWKKWFAAAKRLTYSYRDNSFFFMLIRFLSIPLPNFP